MFLDLWKGNYTQFLFKYLFSDSNLRPFLDQITQIDENVTALEQAAYKLDNYSKRLGWYLKCEKT